MIGRLLYIEAEAAGISTGIGCFLGDPMHQRLGLQGTVIQDLCLFTVGGAVDDPGLSTLPIYPTA